MQILAKGKCCETLTRALIAKEVSIGTYRFQIQVKIHEANELPTNRQVGTFAKLLIKAGISTTPPVEIRIRVLSAQGVCKPCLVLISTPPPPPPVKNSGNIYKFDNKIFFSYKFILDYLNLCHSGI